ncbi:MAG TPA: LysE family translocator [Caldimonas sp.]|nr:LysE family translocator [Caldimonas sp.]
MTAPEFAALLAFATAMSFTPGPNTLLSTALAANFGLRRAWRFIVAVPAGWTLMMLVSALGLGALLTALPWLHATVQGLGVAYLAWLAWKLARTRALPTGADERAAVGFWQGVALQFVNVKAWMLALALAAGWVATSGGRSTTNPGERLAIVCGVMVAFALSSNLLYALAGSLLRRSLAHGSRLLWFNRSMALLLVATAAWMLALPVREAGAAPAIEAARR